MKYVINIIAREKWGAVLSWTRTERGWEKPYESMGKPRIFDDLNQAYHHATGTDSHYREVLEHHE